MNLLEIMEQNAIDIPDRRILADDSIPKGMTYAQAYEISGRVYQYLQDKGIGKEDFVLLLLPRSIQPILALMGVIRNGSAFIIVEDNYAPERIAFIKKDCNAKIVIDAAAWEEILDTPSKEGFEPWDDHAAAFAVYTSGTTGNPKGVLHEYGNITRSIDSTTMRTCDQLAFETDKFGLVAPLNFVASFLIICVGLVRGVFNYIVPYAIIKNPAQTGLFIIKNRITGIFLTPSFIRKLKSKPPMIRFCIIGSEPANGVFLDGMIIHNFYLMSESAFAVCHFLIDKKYEKTPVGDSEFGHKIMLLDDNGNEVKQGEEGEICFENNYCRGYLNLPEETAKAFKTDENGDRIYHTGDLAYRNEDNQIVICGRMNDMVKINGNRVEPGEIEGVVMKVLGIEWAAARIFDENGKVFIAVYYTDNKVNIDFETTRKELEKYLPYYMLPSYFIHIDEVPLRPNGKMDRKALPKPEAESFKSAYEAPRDELDERLCKAFEEVLGVENVGINDDFYQLGGDSLGAMDVLVKSDIHGLTSADIFAGHTPKKIMDIWKDKHPNGEGESDDVLDDNAKKEEQPLTEYQRYMVDYQLSSPKSTMFNLFTMLKFDPNQFEPKKLAKAVEKAVENHPALLTKLSFNADGEIVQKYEPSFAPNLHVQQIDDEAFAYLKDALVAPFKIMNSRLYRLQVYSTPTAGYIFFDAHHTIFDGTSFKVMMQDIIKAYYDVELDRDYYYLFVQEQKNAHTYSRYDEAKKYFESVYDGDFWSTKPKVDFSKAKKNTLSNYQRSLAQNEEAMKKLEESEGITRNAFFATMAMMSIAVFNHKSDVQITWTYNGRDDVRKLNGVGLLLKDLPLCQRFTKNTSILDVCKDVQAQVAKDIEYSLYPYTTIGVEGTGDDLLCFLYQEDIRDGGIQDDMKLEMVDVRQNASAAENILDFQILDGSQGLGISMDYASSSYKGSSMKRFADIYEAAVEVFLENAGNPKFTVGKAVRKIQEKVRETQLIVGWMKYRKPAKKAKKNKA